MEIHSIDQLIEALHPTGAIGAPFGVIDQEENTALFVPIIRGISWEGHQFKIGVGGGVVEGSIYEKEREELFRKFTQVKAFFSL